MKLLANVKFLFALVIFTFASTTFATKNPWRLGDIPAEVIKPCLDTKGEIADIDSQWNHSDVIDAADTRPRSHLLVACKYQNGDWYISNVISGHLTDSSIYIRRTLETIRYCTFIRDNEKEAELWFLPDGKEDFDKGFKKWWSKDSSKKIVESEFENFDQTFKHSSNYGPHANAELFSQQHRITFSEDKMHVQSFFHELDPDTSGYHSLLAVYFWHLKIHAKSIDWWIYKSGFINNLTTDQKSYWHDCRKKLK